MSQKYIQIMLFYILLSYIIFPVIAYYTLGKTFDAAGKGFMLGSIISILLWWFYGRMMV